MKNVRRPCPYCGAEATFETGAVIYPHRRDLASKVFWACLPCAAWTGCHPGTNKRMGRLANAETRQLKMAAHQVFDPIWKSKRMSRTKAYKWLQEQTGLSERECHIGWMSDENLRFVIELCADEAA